MLRGFAQRDYFGVRGGVAISDRAVSGAGHDLIIHYYDCADRYFAALGCGAGFAERAAHESRVAIVVSARNITEWAHFWQHNMEPLREFRRHKHGADSTTVTGPFAIFSSIEQVDFPEARVAFAGVQKPEGEFSARSDRTRGVQVKPGHPTPGRRRTESPSRARCAAAFAAYERGGLFGGDFVARAERMRGGEGQA